MFRGSLTGNRSTGTQYRLPVHVRIFVASSGTFSARNLSEAALKNDKSIYSSCQSKLIGSNYLNKLRARYIIGGFQSHFVHCGDFFDVDFTFHRNKYRYPSLRKIYLYSQHNGGFHRRKIIICFEVERGFSR